jgi:hypothetical protein
MGRRHLAPGKREHAQPARGHFIGLAEHAHLVERPDPAALGEQVVALLDQRFDAAFDVDHLRLLLRAVERGHVFVFGLERDCFDPGHAPAPLMFRQSGLLRGDDQLSDHPARRYVPRLRGLAANHCTASLRRGIR